MIQELNEGCALGNPLLKLNFSISQLYLFHTWDIGAFLVDIEALPRGFTVFAQKMIENK